VPDRFDSVWFYLRPLDRETGSNRRSTMGSYLFRSVAMMAVLVGSVANSGAGESSFTRCATRDMQVLMMLEQSASGNTAAPEVDDALSGLFDARIVCVQGRALDAIAIYDNIASRIGMGPFPSGRTNEAPVRGDFQSTVP
jgi:hypothetical protein